MLFRYELDLYYYTLVELVIKCLEGTTERSDSNTKFADESERSELSEQTR